MNEHKSTIEKEKKRPPYWWCDLIYNLKRAFMYPFQRFFRGYSDSDLWNLDSFYGDIITHSMKAFRDKTCSFPPELTFKEWQAVLDDIIFAFEHESKDWWELADEQKNLSEEEKTKIKERVDKGFNYFKKYYRDLWW